MPRFLAALALVLLPFSLAAAQSDCPIGEPTSSDLDSLREMPTSARKLLSLGNRLGVMIWAIAKPVGLLTNSLAISP